MKKNYERITKVILIVCGLLTAVLGSVLVSAELVLDKLFNLDYVKDYDIIIKHWSMMVFLVGVFLIISAFKVQWRIPVVSFALLEKTYLVITSILALKYTYGESFKMTIFLDTTMNIFLVFVLLNELKKSKIKKVSSS